MKDYLIQIYVGVIILTFLIILGIYSSLTELPFQRKDDFGNYILIYKGGN